MPTEIPYWIKGEVRLIFPKEIYVKVPNGNVYIIKPETPGIEFSQFAIGMQVMLEITSRLTYVYSTKFVEVDM